MSGEKKGNRVTAYYAIGTFHRFVGTDTRREIKDQPTSKVRKAPSTPKRKVARGEKSISVFIRQMTTSSTQEVVSGDDLQLQSGD
jgi:hypothetical protein